MASFIISGSNTTARILAAGEYGLIQTGATLATQGAQSVLINGPSDLAVQGSLIALAGDAVGGSGATTFDMLVGQQGEVISLVDAGVDVAVSERATMRNNGTVSGEGPAVRLQASDGAANLRLVNSGLIEASGTAAILSSGTGRVDVVNSGRLQTADPQLQDAVLATGASVRMENTGSVIGTLVLEAASGARLVNTGLILGDVVLGKGASDDVFINAGGAVTGTVFGGGGNDTYIIDRNDLRIRDFSGDDTVESSVSYSLEDGLDRLVLTGSADLTGGGNSGANVLTGNAGDNRLFGRGGSDVMTGGLGDDILYGGSENDTLRSSYGDDRLFGGAGRDTLLTSVYGAISVNLALGRMQTESGDQVILSGIENVTGGASEDTIIGNAGDNLLDGGGRRDRLEGGDGNDTLIGGVFIDVLSGGSGNDVLQGDSGSDVLTGGTGADHFVFVRLDDSDPVTTDRITDFTRRLDRIDLSAIDANRSVAGDGAFRFGGANFSSEGIPSVRVVLTLDTTLVLVRDSQGAEIDMRIELAGIQALTAADFVL